MSWLFLTLAIILEVCGTTCMKLSEGFSRLVPSILIFVFYGFSFAAFTLALKRIDLSFAYAVWAGLGVLLIGTIGIVYFKEPISVVKAVSMVLIVAGVVGLHVSRMAH
jgi:small multidrug resistance pump